MDKASVELSSDEAQQVGFDSFFDDFAGIEAEAEAIAQSDMIGELSDQVRTIEQWFAKKSAYSATQGIQPCLVCRSSSPVHLSTREVS
jgi:hypothetical protein